MKKDRSIYIDLLRILCCVSVILIHVSATVWYDFSIISRSWALATWIDVAVRFCVPVFFMISGALFLSRDKIDMKKVYKKNILKMFIILALWLPIHAVVSCYKYGGSITSFAKLYDVLKGLLDNQYQFWFIVEMIPIYITLPIIKKISEDKKVLEYFLVLFFIFDIIKSSIELMFGYSNKVRLFTLFEPDVVVGYFGYFLLGYYLYKYEIKKVFRYISYILSIVSVVAASLTIIIVSRSRGEVYFPFFGYHIITTMITSIGIFLLFKNCFKNIKLNKKVEKVVNIISKSTLGIYILHNLVKWGFEAIGVSVTMLPTPLSIPIFTILIFAVSLIITLILKKIPFIGKYIV